MALNVRTIKQLTEPGRYSDGQGLYLHIRSGGSRQWVLRTTINQKRCDVGIGALESISLAEARDLAYELRKEAKAGGDPLADRRKVKTIPTFKEASITVWEANKPTWKNEKLNSPEFPRRLACSFFAAIQSQQVTASRF
jgi:hypothetical protein